jgi:periplasmic divalent cation tolerance protein
MSESTSSTNYGIVFTTVGSQEEAQAIAAALVQEHLVACVNIFPIHSVYIWQDQVQNDNEYQLIMKTDLAKFEAIARRVTSLHAYDLPELVAIPIAHGSADYLQWISEQV